MEARVALLSIPRAAPELRPAQRGEIDLRASLKHLREKFAVPAAISTRYR